MRRQQEVKEDYPFMASERVHAQSEFTCIASSRKCVNILSDIVLIVFIVSLACQETGQGRRKENGTARKRNGRQQEEERRQREANPRQATPRCAR
jgi:hypothetical protein